MGSFASYKSRPAVGFGAVDDVGVLLHLPGTVYQALGQNGARAHTIAGMQAHRPDQGESWGPNAVKEDVLIHSVIRETVIEMRVGMEERQHMDGVTVLQAGQEHVARKVVA